MKKQTKKQFLTVRGGGMKWLAVLLCFAAGFGLSACGDDDDTPTPENPSESGGGTGGGTGGNTGGTGTVVAQQLPRVSDAGIDFPVREILNGSDGYYISETYNYASDGRMTSGTIRDDKGDVTTFSFGSNPLTYTSRETGEGNYSMTARNIRVNESGFVTYVEYSWNEDGESDSGSISLNYDAEGHLVEANGHEVGEEYTWRMTWTWENGNVVRSYFDDTYDSELCTYTYDASKSRPNSGIYVTTLVDDYDCFDGTFLFYSGALGRPSRNIPVSIRKGSRSYYMPSDEQWNITVLDYNVDGSISRVGMTNDASSNGETEDYYFGYTDYPIPRFSYSVAPGASGRTIARTRKARRIR